MNIKTISLRSLCANLKRSGRAVRRLDFSSGTVVVLPEGGRVIGLFAKNAQSNFLWTHDSLRSAAGIRKLYAESRWPNPGGDRTWLAPTTQLFVSDLKRFWETWREPVAVDPGKYVCREIGGRLHLVNRAMLELRRHGQIVEVEINKGYDAAPTPCAPSRKSRGFTPTPALRQP